MAAPTRPETGESVLLRLEGSNDTLPCTVILAGAKEVVLAPDMERIGDLELASRAAATLDWATRRGQARLPAMIVHPPDEESPTVIVEVYGDPEVTQRRGHVRATINMRMQITIGDRKGFGRTEDISGGGMRARFPTTELEVGDVVEAKIQFEDELLPTVLRVTASYGDHLYGLSFEELSEGERERVIRAVFERLRMQTRLD